MRPHRRQPTRPPRPWGSPGKSTGVGAIEKHAAVIIAAVTEDQSVTSQYLLSTCLVHARYCGLCQQRM